MVFTIKHQSLAIYTTSADYINNLAFAHIETYSLLRGPEYEENEKLLRAEYDRLKAQKEKQDGLTAEEEVRIAELFKLVIGTQYLINDKGAFHPSSKKINSFSVSDPMVDRLKTILNTEVKSVPLFLCEAIYRDAVVFYNSNHQVVSVLNVCLGCNYMASQSNQIKADWETYDLLKHFFIDIGHDVENPENFHWEDMKRQYEKRYKRKK